MRSITSSWHVGLTYCSPSSHSTAAQSWRLVEWTSRSVVATILMFGNAFDRRVDHPEERVRVELRLGLLRTSGPFDAEALLQVLLVADQAIDVLDDPPQRLAARCSPPTDAHSFAR